MKCSLNRQARFFWGEEDPYQQSHPFFTRTHTCIKCKHSLQEEKRYRTMMWGMGYNVGASFFSVGAKDVCLQHVITSEDDGIACHEQVYQPLSIDYCNNSLHGILHILACLVFPFHSEHTSIQPIHYLI